MRKKLKTLAGVLLPLLLACGYGREDQTGQSAAAPDTTAPALEQPAESAPQRRAQMAWDTADSSSFDVEEINRRRKALEDSIKQLQEVPPPMTRKDSLNMLMNIMPDSNGAFSYLQPSEFPGLPREISEWLVEREYVIPQVVPPIIQYLDQDSTPKNAIKGEFIRPGQLDWAIYCTDRQSIWILVFPRSSTDSLIIVDKNEKTGKQLSGNYDLIYKISAEALVNYCIRLEKEKQDSSMLIDHDGISIGSPEYSDYDIYYHDRRWYVFMSNDDE